MNHFTEAETDQAFQLAKRKQLPVLVDFWAPACKGYKKNGTCHLSKSKNPELC